MQIYNISTDTIPIHDITQGIIRISSISFICKWLYGIDVTADSLGPEPGVFSVGACMSALDGGCS